MNRLKQHIPAHKKLPECNILIYGVTYKRDIPDTRESTALELIRLLKKEGVDVSYHDPLIPSVQIDGDTLSSVELTKELIGGTDCVLIHTNHSNIPLELILENASLVFDARNVTGDRADPGDLAGATKIVKLGGGAV
ncbi:MAG: UDP-N-acetyl-D-glucosamine dehydrogenase [Paenibacillaceae bacterium]|nr:UDP-N-acetyl-D-glucosamine dehydrogenase [Paenibacillaceae bacterium]